MKKKRRIIPLYLRTSTNRAGVDMALHSNITWTVAMLWINLHSSMERTKSHGILLEGFDVKDDYRAVRHASCCMHKFFLIVSRTVLRCGLFRKWKNFLCNGSSRVMQCVNMCQYCYVGFKTRKYQRQCVELWIFKRYFPFAVYRQSKRDYFLSNERLCVQK